jgi:hypothetical protein
VALGHWRIKYRACGRGARHRLALALSLFPAAFAEPASQPTRRDAAVAATVALLLFHALTAGICFLAFEKSDPRISLSTSDV